MLRMLKKSKQISFCPVESVEVKCSVGTEQCKAAVRSVLLKDATISLVDVVAKSLNPLSIVFIREIAKACSIKRMLGNPDASETKVAWRRAKVVVREDCR
jgi:hypothetical protein